MTEQKKRRFVIYVFAQDPIGIECDDWSWDMIGLCFYGGGADKNKQVVFAVAPGQWRSFYEMADDNYWPYDVKMILSEKGRRRLTNATIRSNE